MPAEYYLALSVGGFVVAAVTAIGARALQEFSRHELEVYCRVRKQPQLFGEVLDEHDQRALGASTMCGMAVAIYLAAGVLWLSTPSAEGQIATGWRMVVPLCLGVVGLLLVTVWIPRSVVHVWSAPFVYNTWHLWQFVSAMMLPLAPDWK